MMRAIRWNSLRTKLAFFSLVVGLALLAVVVVVIEQVRGLESRIRDERTATRAFDLIRDVRYREFRLFLYRGQNELADLQEAIAAADWFAREHGEALEAAVGPATARRFADGIVAYRLKLGAYWGGGRPAERADGETEEGLRSLRRSLVDEVEQASRIAAQGVEQAIEEQRLTLGGAFAAVFVVMLAMAFFLVRRLLAPLRSIEQQMERVAAAKTRRVEFSSADHELVALASAFNHVMVELEARQAGEIQAGKLASLGTMLSGVAHELNNPLSNISTSVQILAEEIDQLTVDEVRPLLERIDRQTERAKAIVRTLLEHARAEVVAPQPVGVAELVASAVDAVTAGRQPPRPIRCEVPPDLVVDAVPERLRRALINLLQNAIDATSVEDPIVVFARRAPAGDPAMVEIAVQDCGSGMAPEAAQHAFDPFYTTKATGQGTGLGLFIAHDIVRRHGGTIALQSIAGVGTSAIVRLPGKQD